MDFQVRNTWVSGGSGIYKLYALEQASLPYYSLVSPSEKWNNSDTYLTGLLWELNEIMHAKGLTIPCIYSKLSIKLAIVIIGNYKIVGSIWATYRNFG